MQELLKKYAENKREMEEIKFRHVGPIGPRNPLPLRYYDLGIENVELAKKLADSLSEGM
jgi:hypothetical protein